MTIFSVDVETSGLNPIIHDVTSIAIIADTENQEFIRYRVDPGPDGFNWDEDTREWASKNIPPSVEEFEALKPADLCATINEFLAQFPKPWTFMAWPASFDYPFVQGLFMQTLADSPFHYRTVDIHSLLVGRFGGDISKGRSDNDGIVPAGIIVEPGEGQIHNPYYDAKYQLETYRNFMAYTPEWP